MLLETSVTSESVPSHMFVQESVKCSPVWAASDMATVTNLISKAHYSQKVIESNDNFLLVF